MHDEVARMAGDDQDISLLHKLRHSSLSLVLESLITDGKPFVHQQDFGPNHGRDRKRQAKVHAGGIGAHRHVDEVAKFGKLNDFLYLACYITALKPQQATAQVDILTSRGFPIDTQGYVQQGPDLPRDASRASRRLIHATKEAQQRTLPRAVMTEQTHPVTI